MAEAFRSGLEAIPDIQRESAYSLGFTKAQTLGYLISPQALSVSMPALKVDLPAFS